MDRTDKTMWITKLWDPLEKMEESPLHSKREGIKVAAYCRVSLDSLELSHSLESQVSHYTHVINEKENWIFVGIYFDNLVTGRKASLRRGFTRMLRHCAEGRIDLILVKNVSRFSRNTKELIETVERLNELNVAVYFETENITSNISSTTYLLKTYAGIAQGEIEAASKAIEWGHEKSMMKGKANTCRFYGYDRSKTEDGMIITINNKQAQVVREIYHMYLDGMNFNSIAADLTRRNIKTYFGRDHWESLTIKSILTNIGYTGDVLTRKTFEDLMSTRKKSSQGIRDQYLIEEHHPAIISHETFDKVQEMIPQVMSKRTNKKSDMNGFSRRLKCGNCGLSFSLNSVLPWHYYKCAASRLNQKLCDTPTIREDAMTSMLLRAFGERFNTQDRKIIKTLQKILTKINQNDHFEFHRLRALTDIQLAKKLINVQYTQEEVNQLEEAYRRFEVRLSTIEDDRQYRIDAIDWTGKIGSFEEFQKQATIEYMRAWILGMVIYSKEDFKVYWIDGKETEIGSCIPIKPKREEPLIETQAEGDIVQENGSQIELMTDQITLEKGGDQNKEEESMTAERKPESDLMVKSIRRQINSSVEMQYSLPAVRKERLKVAAYVRVSTEHEQQTISLKTQYTYYLYLLLKEPTYELAGIYVDDGKTGTTTRGRTEFNRMIEDCRKGKIDLIITKSLSRFARNTVDTLQYLNILNSLEPKVSVFFERENLNSSDKRSDILIKLLSAISQEESISLSESISWGKRSLAQRGVINPARVGYGFEKGENNKWVVSEDKAMIVRRIYGEYLQGSSIRKIAIHLAEDHIPSPTGNEHWDNTTIDRMLRSEIYHGDYVYQRYHTGSELIKKRIKNSGELPMYYIENHHPSIIDTVTWEKAQQEILLRDENWKNRKKYEDAKNKNDCFSKIFSCGECGAVIGYARWNLGRNRKHCYDVWICSHSNKGRCSSRSFYQAYIEENFMQFLMDFKFDNDFQEHLKEYKNMLSIKPNESELRIVLEKTKEELSQKLYQAVEKELGKEGKNPKSVDELIERILAIREQLKSYINREERLIAIEDVLDTVLKRFSNIHEGNKNKFSFYVSSPAFQTDLFKQLIEKGILYDTGRISYQLFAGLEWSTELKYENYQEKMKHQREIKLKADKEAFFKSPEIKKLLEYCSTPKTLAELHQYYGKYSTKQIFKKRIITPLIGKGMIRMTIPDIPQSRSQKFMSINID